MGFDPNIKRAVKRLANRKAAEIEERSIYESRQLAGYLKGLSGTLLGNQKEALNVVVESCGKDGLTACTNGGNIVINWENELFSRYESVEARFEAFLGGFFHEMSHVLYLDFDTLEKALNTIAGGHMYGEEPETEPEDENMLEEFRQAMADPVCTPLFKKIFCDLSNILADRHDEDLMTDRFGNLVRPGISKVRESLHSYARPYDEMAEMTAKGRASRLAVAYDAILQMSRFGSVFMFDTGLWKTDDILTTLKKCFSDIEDAVCEDSLRKRFTYINRIAFALWPLIKEIVEKQKESAGQNQAQSLEQAVSEIMSEISSAAQNISGAPMPANRSTSASATSAGSSVSVSTGSSSSAASGAAADDEDSAFDDSGGSSQSTKEILASVINNVASEAAEKEMEQQMASDVCARIRTVDMNSTHKGVPLCIERKLEAVNLTRCMEIEEKIRPYTQRMKRLMEEVLRDIQIGGLQKHRPFGRKLVPNDTYRPDGRYYAKKNVPRDMPDMAISVLVDNSGSMFGSRIEAAREAALMVYDFATSLNIPVSVCGHTTDDSTVVFRVFADFEKASDRDRERIAAMEPYDCNRDGMALEIAGSLLSRRPETCRLLFIISDGQPNHDEYGGEGAAEDIQSIVKRYRNQGIEIIAAAIGSDRDMIQSIYGDGFLDIESLETLPKIMVKIIKKRIMNMI